MRDILGIVQHVRIRLSSRASPVPSDIRTALDLMCNVQTLQIHGQIVGNLTDALSIEPPKLVNHLVIEDWVGNGDQVREYMEKVRVQANSGSVAPKVSFVNCPNIPNDLWEQVAEILSPDDGASSNIENGVGDGESV
jgi:hypothetical protein